MKTLALTDGLEPDPKEACKQLVAVAIHYNVMRGFKVEEEGTARLAPVWDALRKMERPTSAEDAKAKVSHLVAELRHTYHQDLVSAASKILWMRFGSPIVIYDSIVSKWIYDKGDRPMSKDYGYFYDAWQRKFGELGPEIRIVCEGLKELSTLRKFFGLNDLCQDEFEKVVSSPWFAERVFDHAILNVGTLER